MTNLDGIKLFQWISNQTERGNKSACAVNRAADILEVDVNEIYKAIGSNEAFKYKTRQKALPGWMKAVRGIIGGLCYTFQRRLTIMIGHQHRQRLINTCQQCHPIS